MKLPLDYASPNLLKSDPRLVHVYVQNVIQPYSFQKLTQILSATSFYLNVEIVLRSF